MWNNFSLFRLDGNTFDWFIYRFRFDIFSLYPQMLYKRPTFIITTEKSKLCPYAIYKIKHWSLFLITVLFFIWIFSGRHSTGKLFPSLVELILDPKDSWIYETFDLLLRVTSKIILNEWNQVTEAEFLNFKKFFFCFVTVCYAENNEQ